MAWSLLLPTKDAMIAFALPITATMGGIAVIVVIISMAITPKFSYKGKHVVVTGGSAGIGLELAKEYLRRGASVTIVARNQKRLDEAVLELNKLKLSTVQEVKTIAVDVSSGETAVHKAFEGIGAVDVIVNNAGISACGEFDVLPADEFERLLKTNVLGSVYPTRSVLAGMKLRRSGRVVFVSSQVGHAAVHGYSAYAASKWALRGMAEALQMELLPYNIYVSVAYPPDTNTPGYEEEMKVKPAVTKAISESGSVFEPSAVARDIVDCSAQGYFTISTGFDGWLLKHLHPGMTPTNNLLEVLQQVIFCPVRIIAVVYVLYWNSLCSSFVSKANSADKKSK